MTQHWYTYLFMIFAAIAVLGASISATYKLTHRLIYAMFLFCIWTALAYWTYQ